MAEVVPFRPWLYNTAVAGPLDALLAPPYDVIGPDLQNELYAGNPANVVRVDLNREADPERRYAEAAGTVGKWRSEGVLVRAEKPQVTVLKHRFVGPDGQERVRTGILACVRLAEFGEEVIFPHEYTLSGPKEDRFRLMTATGMALSPVFLLYDGGDKALRDALDVTVRQTPDQVAEAPGTRVGSGKGEFGELLRIWHSKDSSLPSALRVALAEQPLVIADGHHRYETALRYRGWRRAAAAKQGRELSSDDASEYFLAYLVDMTDPGLAIFATHRLLRNVVPDRLAALPEVLAECFVVDRLSVAASEAETAIRRYLDDNASGPAAFGVFVPGTGEAYGLRLTADPVASRFTAGPGKDATAPSPSPAALSLDVSVLQNFILDKVFGISAESVAGGDQVVFVKEWDEAFSLLNSRECQVGFFLNPTRLDQVVQMALRGERMPQKSTYFYPKVPTGLVFLDLNGSL